MMGLLSRLLVSLGLDATEYGKGLAKADSETGSKLSSIGGKLQGLGQDMQGMGMGLTAGVTVPIAAMGLAAVDAASDLEESMSKVNVVFADSSDGVITFSENAATALGQSQQEALEAAGTFGNLFVSMEMAPAVAADMSTSLVTLGSDLASFNNSMPIEALDALRAGLTGETEPLKRFGVNINAAAVAQKALDLGIVETTVDTLKAEKARMKFINAQVKATEAEREFGKESLKAREAQLGVKEAHQEYEAALAGTTEELTAAQKAQAVYALVMDQTATAQGDFARTSEGLANSTRIAKAQLADAAATMGQHLLPIGLKVVNFVTDLISKFTALSPQTQKVILVVAGLAAAIGPLLMVGGTLISTIGSIVGLMGAAGITAAGFMSALLPIVAVIAAIVAGVVLFKAAWDNDFMGIRTTLIELWENTLKPIFTMLWEWLQVNIPLAIETLRGWWADVLWPAILKVGTWMKVNLLPLFEALGRLLKVVVGKAIEFLAALWGNVLQPALKTVWEFIKDRIQPVFQAVVALIEMRLGPVFKWLVDNVLGPVSTAFGAIGDVIGSIIGFINDLIEKIKAVELPWWMQPGSPTPWELGLWGINRALKAVARSGMPELEVAIQGVSRGGSPVGAGMGAETAPLQGDQIVIHNHGAAAAALTMAEVEARRRARLNFSMG